MKKEKSTHEEMVGDFPQDYLKSIITVPVIIIIIIINSNNNDNINKKIIIIILYF